jgi:small Trp-rich protein
MWFLVIGLVLVVLKLADVAPVAGWSWWWFLVPFGATALWWFLADATGLTAKREQQRWQERREKRRQDALEKMRPHKGSAGRRVQVEDPTRNDKR